MRDKTANVAVQIPAFTANTVRRCKMYAVLVDQHSDVFSWRHGTWALRAYLENAVVVRLRTSKNVKTAAIKMSTPAAIERDEVPISCPADTEVVGLEHETYTYREETITELKELNNVYTRSGW
jgi:hypothetical protein